MHSGVCSEQYPSVKPADTSSRHRRRKKQCDAKSSVRRAVCSVARRAANLKHPSLYENARSRYLEGQKTITQLIPTTIVWCNESEIVPRMIQGYSDTVNIPTTSHIAFSTLTAISLFRPNGLDQTREAPTRTCVSRTQQPLGLSREILSNKLINRSVVPTEDGHAMKTSDTFHSFQNLSHAVRGCHNNCRQVRTNITTRVNASQENGTVEG